MNDWASRLLSVFPETTKKAELDQFIQEVSNDQVERMYIQKKIDVALETRPTFEQLSLDRILDEMNKNLVALKSLEGIVQERMMGYGAFYASITKTRPFFEGFDSHEGTLRLAFDSFSVLIEQEILQSKQQVFLGDLRKSLASMRADSQKRIIDYQKEISAAEKDVQMAEAKLMKSKERHEKGLDHRSRMENFEQDTPSRLPSRMNSAKEDRLRDADETIAKGQKDIQDDVRMLLRVIGNRDQVLTASRKAFQKLDGECKAAVHSTLKKIVEKEKENADIHKEIVEKLDSSVHNVNLEMDTTDFIEGYGRTDGALLLCSQALSLLGDLTPTGLPHSEGAGVRSGRTSGSASPMPRSRSSSFSNKETPMKISNSSSSSSAGAGSAVGPSRQNSHSNRVSTMALAGSGLPSAAGSTAADLGHLPPNLLVGMSKSQVDAALSPDSAPAQALAQAAVAETAAAASAKLALNRAFTANLCKIFYHNTKLPEDLASFASVPAGGGDSNSLVLDDLEKEQPATHDHFSDDEEDDVVVGSRGLGGGKQQKRRSLGTDGREHSDDWKIDSCRSSSVSSDKGGGGGGRTSTASTIKSIRAKIPNWVIHPTGGRVSGPIKRLSKHVGAVIKEKTGGGGGGGGGATPQRLSEGEKFGDKWNSHVVPVIEGNFDDDDEDDEDDIAAAKREYRKNKVDHNISYRDLSSPATVDWLTAADSGSKKYVELVEAVGWICKAVRTQTARNIFTAELNQFRSRQVDIGEGFDALGAVLWATLSNCQKDNDVHNAKVIMMLSQTFFRQINQSNRPSESKTDRASASSSSSRNSRPNEDNSDNGEDNSGDDEGEAVAARGSQNREYIKERLTAHPLWKDAQFWEQALWQCTIEQLQTMPYEQYWHDMNNEDRTRAVRRVHDVIFSQVMAITHSMVELGCSPTLSREFLYRMCVIHQLGEAQRQQLLTHVLVSNNNEIDNSEVQDRSHMHDNVAMGANSTEKAILGLSTATATSAAAAPAAAAAATSAAATSAATAAATAATSAAAAAATDSGDTTAVAEALTKINLEDAEIASV